MGKSAQCLVRFLFKSWTAERLSRQLSKLQPNQAPCHLSVNSASSCQAQESSGTLMGGGRGRHLARKRNLRKFRWSDDASSSISCCALSFREASYLKEGSNSCRARPAHISSAALNLPHLIHAMLLA
ncbi:hypothetical protein VZT92_000873 [Zoarces viviparus]